jgi:hypothetical protein
MAAGAPAYVDVVPSSPAVKRITLVFTAFSTSGTSVPMLRLGAGGSVETAGYAGTVNNLAVSAISSAATAASAFEFMVSANSASNVFTARIELELIDPATNSWQCSMFIGKTSAAGQHICLGSKSLAGVLDKIRFTTTNGTDTIDGGTLTVTEEW